MRAFRDHFPRNQVTLLQDDVVHEMNLASISKSPFIEFIEFLFFKPKTIFLTNEFAFEKLTSQKHYSVN